MESPSSTDTEFRTRIHQQEVIAKLGQCALESDDLDQLMHDASAAVVDTLDIEYCAVLELLPDGDEVLLRQGAGWQKGITENVTDSTDHDSLAGYTLRSEEPVIVTDLRSEERFSGPDLLLGHDIVSGISVIIGSVDDPWGVLWAHTTETRAFTEYDVNFVRSVANVLASAIDRTQKEGRLREREAQLDVATKAASIGLWTWDIQENVVTADDYLAESYGFDPEAVATGAPMEAFYEPILEEDTEQTWNQLERAVEETGKLEAEYRVRDADGDIMWLVARGEVIYGDDGDPIRLNGAVADITERKQRERELARSEKRYRTLFESIDEGFCVIEQVDTPPGEPIDFRYVEANPAFEEQSGVGDVVGKTIREVVPEEPQEWFDIYESVAQTGEAVRFERELVTEGRVLECYAFQVGDGSNGRVGVIFTDVTERVEHQREITASNQRLEQFAYAVSHDLQEPLRTISNYLRLIERRYEDDLDDTGREFIEFAVDGAERMRAMIDGLLDYSRVEIQGDPFEPVDLDSILAAVRDDIGMKIEESGAEITADPLPRVEGDADQLRQVFQNLLDNAIAYSGDEPPRIHVSADREGSKWRISVRDTGIGIDPADRERIFRVFQRLHTYEEQAGTGIGLALCERIVDRHGGDIWVESNADDGSTFLFTLPAASDH